MLLFTRSYQLCVTPWTAAHQVPLSMGFSRQESWSGLLWPPPGDLPDPGVELGFPALQVGSLLAEPPGKPPFLSGFALYCVHYLNLLVQPLWLI